MSWSSNKFIANKIKHPNIAITKRLSKPNLAPRKYQTHVDSPSLTKTNVNNNININVGIVDMIIL